VSQEKEERKGEEKKNQSQLEDAWENGTREKNQ